MGVTGNLATLRQRVLPLGGEVMIEGWAAERICGDERVLGLVLVTSWRIVFVAPQGGLTAFPISKIDYAEHRSPTCVVLSTWYDRMQLSFDSPAALGAVATLLRQDPCWSGAEFGLSRAPADNAADPSLAPLEVMA